MKVTVQPKGAWLAGKENKAVEREIGGGTGKEGSKFFSSTSGTNYALTWLYRIIIFVQSTLVQINCLSYELEGDLYGDKDRGLG
ncbi:MAG: hypothetical protein ACFFD4_12195 [Candidatus Odinarchaeota archaeon]